MLSTVEVWMCVQCVKQPRGAGFLGTEYQQEVHVRANWGQLLRHRIWYTSALRTISIRQTGWPVKHEWIALHPAMAMKKPDVSTESEIMPCAIVCAEYGTTGDTSQKCLDIRD